MTSSLGWVLFGDAEAEAVQALIGSLSDSEARDELGLGAIRDGFANLLFPGTSTVQTRLRYFLLIPQLFRDLDLRSRDRAAVLRAAEAQLIARIQSLPDDADKELLIGSEAGEKLKRMPSAAYWGGLGLWDIRLNPRAGIGAVLDRMAEGEECWNETPRIPDTDSRGFALTTDEAEWFADRCAALRQGSTLLGHLMKQASDVAPITELAQVAALDLPAAMQRQLDHALAFAATMHGAQLLYNLMLAERFDADGVEYWTGQLRDWTREKVAIAPDAGALIAPLIEQAAIAGFTPKAPTLRFIDAWLPLMRNPDGPEARALIARREIETKRNRARLRLDPRDYTWQGSAGAGRLNFRWGRVHRYLRDMAAAA